MDAEASGAGFSVFRKEMAEMADDPKTLVEETPKAGPPQTGTGGDDFNATQWLQSFDARQRAAVDEYAAFKAKPMESELHGLRTENGRLKKASDPIIASRLGKEERLVELLRASAVALYGPEVEDDLKDIDNLESFSTALRFLSRGVRKTDQKANPAADADKATQEAWKEFLATRNAGAETKDAKPGDAGNWGLDLSGGRRTAPSLSYKEILKSGKPLPPAEEIDRMVARSFQR